MNPNCLYTEPGDWTWVATVQGEAANHYTNDAGDYIRWLALNKYLRIPLSYLLNMVSEDSNIIFLIVFQQMTPRTFSLAPVGRLKVQRPGEQENVFFSIVFTEPFHQYMYVVLSSGKPHTNNI